MKSPVISMLNRPFVVICACLCWCYSTLGTAQSPVLDMNVVQPEAGPYHIGDKFSRTLELSLAPPYKLDETSLPGPRVLPPWLRVEKPFIEKSTLTNGTRYAIELTYQIVNIDPKMLDIGVSSHIIEIYAADERYTLLIPATRVRAEPIIADGARDVQPNAMPMLVTNSPRRVVGYGVLFCVSLLGLLLAFFGIPFCQPRPPFARLYRHLRRNSKSKWSEQEYQQTLRAIHRAFDETAGHVIFADELKMFFAKNPAFIPLTSNIERFFEHTYQYFYRGGEMTSPTLSTAEIIDLVSRCDAVERAMLSGTRP